MVKTMISMFSNGEFSNDLNLYTTGAAQTELFNDVAFLRNNHLVMRGGPDNDPQVTAVNSGATPQTVTITDCWDTHAWTTVYAADPTTGPVQQTGKPPTQAVATVTDLSIGWRVTQFTISASTPCAAH